MENVPSHMTEKQNKNHKMSFTLKSFPYWLANCYKPLIPQTKLSEYFLTEILQQLYYKNTHLFEWAHYKKCVTWTTAITAVRVAVKK